MKLLIIGDIHISKQSSLINKRGTKFSQRLEHCINSINWCEKLAEEQNCDKIVYLGDTFDQPELDDETLTAIKDIKWNKNLTHYFIVGNHESTENDLKYNSVKAIEGKNRLIISQPQIIAEDNLELCFLPYITEVSRKPLNEYFPKTTNKRIIFSHNDLAGIQLGQVISKNGVNINEIDQLCDLFINGHLHNGTWINKKIRNLGILTGQNFLEDAFLYPHNVMILDTETLTYEDFENPYAFNFYKINIDTEEDIKKLDNIKNNAALYLVYNEQLVDKFKDKLAELEPKIAAIRMVRALSTVLTQDLDISNLQVDHLKLLVEFCENKFGANEDIMYELQEICK